MKKAYGIGCRRAARPTDLIQAMLKAEVELLYFGGIGTYVKAESTKRMKKSATAPMIPCASMAGKSAPKSSAKAPIWA